MRGSRISSTEILELAGAWIRTRDLRVMSRFRGVLYLPICRDFVKLRLGSLRSNLLVLVPVWYPFSSARHGDSHDDRVPPVSCDQAPRFPYRRSPAASSRHARSLRRRPARPELRARSTPGQRSVLAVPLSRSASRVPPRCTFRKHEVVDLEAPGDNRSLRAWSRGYVTLHQPLANRPEPLRSQARRRGRSSRKPVELRPIPSAPSIRSAPPEITQRVDVDFQRCSIASGGCS